jgi:hypothetical protein
MRLAAKPAKIVKRTGPAKPPLSTKQKVALMAGVVVGNFILVFVVVAVLVKFWLH